MYLKLEDVEEVEEGVLKAFKVKSGPFRVKILQKMFQESCHSTCRAVLLTETADYK